MNKGFLNATLRRDFNSFVVKVFNEVSAGTEYKDNWHISVICDAVMDMMEGKNNRLIVNIPPRYMKSIICSVALPAFLLGRSPETNIICVSYSDDLASKFANDCRNILQTAWYRELFPSTKMSASRRAINDFETTVGGGRFATSIGGTLTGRGADWIIIDDPLKPSDAMSDTQREKVNDWYGSTLYSRLNDKLTGKIMVIMQRLHQNDLTGFLKESDANYKHIKLPAIAEEDETWKTLNRITKQSKVYSRKENDLLHPDRENMDAIASIRSNLGVFAFAGQYQQRPSPLEGGLIQKEWMHFCSVFPTSFRYIFLSWDTACQVGEKNAFSACVILGLGHDGKIYLLNCFRERLKFPDLFKKMIIMHENAKNIYQGSHVETLIEEASSGIQAIQQLNADYPKFKIIPVKPSQDKVSRLQGVSSHIENGKVLFPNNAGYWWKDFEKELLTFPVSTFKDQCDALSQGIEHAAAKAARKVYTAVI